MALSLPDLIEYCESHLAGWGAAAQRSRPVECPRCGAAGVSIVVRAATFVCCLVCGLGSSSSLIGGPAQP